MALQHIQSLHPLSSSVKGIALKDSTSFSPTAFLSRKIQNNAKVSCSGLCLPNLMRSSFLLAGSFTRSGYRAAKMVAKLKSDNGKDNGGAESSASDGEDDPFVMNEKERQEFRRKIREVVDINPEVEEEADVDERKKKMQELLTNYPLVVEEDDPNWPEDADGWGFSMGQFFDKVTIKNNKKDDDDDDDENYDSEDEMDWQDDNYIRPVKDITAREWEETLFKDISPLVILVHNRYKRPKANEEIRNELENANHIIWNCGLPSPRCVAVDAVVELDLVSALGVSVFPELLFTKAGKILYREKELRTADELSKMMAFFYYGAAKPPCVDIAKKTRSLASIYNHRARKSLGVGYLKDLPDRCVYNACIFTSLKAKILHLCFELDLAYILAKAEEILPPEVLLKTQRDSKGSSSTSSTGSTLRNENVLLMVI